MATASASPVSISMPAEPAAPKAMRANCSLAEALRALVRISFMASSSAPPSSSSSRPLFIAPTGEMMSWQTRLQRSAARSGAESVKSSAMAKSLLKFRVPSEPISVAPADANHALPTKVSEYTARVRAASKSKTVVLEKVCSGRMPDRAASGAGLRTAIFMCELNG